MVQNQIRSLFLLFAGEEELPSRIVAMSFCGPRS